MDVHFIRYKHSTNQQTLQIENMAMKKPTKTDISAGRVFRCGNCDAFCDDDTKSLTEAYVMGRPQTRATTYYCDRDCARKHCRDKCRPNYEEKIKNLKVAEAVLKVMLQRYILEGKKSKTLFQAIKTVRQYYKTLTMLLSGESTLHIMKVEFFKVSEAAMELAELIGEEEDPQFNAIRKNFPAMGPVTLILAQNTAMFTRSFSDDKNETLSLWFN